MSESFQYGVFDKRPFRRLPSNGAWAVGLVTYFALSGLARAGMSVEVTDDCSKADRSPAAEARDDRVVTHNQISGPEVLVIRDYDGNPTRWGCAKVTLVRPKNVPEGPAVGATEAAGDLSDEDQQVRLDSFYQLIDGAITIRQSGSFEPYWS